MESIRTLFANEALVTAFIAWVIAALLKFIIIAVNHRRLDWERLLGTGGMPSTHTTPVIACTTSIGLITGIDSPIFAIGVVLSIVVAYDATGIRRQAGEQAKAINSLIADLTDAKLFKGKQKSMEFFKKWNLFELQTLMGHNPIEVAVGVILGIVTALVVHFYYGHIFAT